MTKMKIPKEEDWCLYEADLDTKYAYTRFASKTIDEVVPYFANGVLGACEDLSNMPDIPFRFYVLAFKQFLMNAELLGPCRTDFEVTEGAFLFLRLLLETLEQSPRRILPVMEELLPTAEYIATNQELLDAPLDDYGSFPQRLVEIKAAYKAGISRHDNLTMQ